MQIDIGFGDIVYPGPEESDLPTMLGSPAPRLLCYSRESAIAEKFEAMVKLGVLNSRMKDYYDLWLISETFEFDGRSLQKAIEATFKKRDTEIPSERPLSLSTDFARASQTRWINFLNKMELENPQVEDFQSVLEMIWTFLEHPVRSSLNQTKSTRKWKPQKGWK